MKEGSDAQSVLQTPGREDLLVENMFLPLQTTFLLEWCVTSTDTAYRGFKCRCIFYLFRLKYRGPWTLIGSVWRSKAKETWAWLRVGEDIFCCYMEKAWHSVILKETLKCSSQRQQINACNMILESLIAYNFVDFVMYWIICDTSFLTSWFSSCIFFLQVFRVVLLWTSSTVIAFKRR